MTWFWHNIDWIAAIVFGCAAMYLKVYGAELEQEIARLHKTNDILNRRLNELEEPH